MLRSTWLFTLGALGILALGCTFRGTTESIVDTTENITISTSGTSSILRDHQRLLAFVRENPENLERDIVRAEGEYLHSFSELLRVRPDQHQAFAQHLQARYPVLAASSSTDRRLFTEHLLRVADESGYVTLYRSMKD